MFVDKLLLPGLVLPAVVAAAVALWLPAPFAAPRRGIGGTALGAGFLAAFAAISGLPRWPPVEATQKLFFITLAACVAAPLVARLRPGRAGLLLEGVVGLALPALLLQVLIGRTWSGAVAVAVLGALGAAAVIVSRAVGAGLERRPTGIDPLVRLALVGGIAVSLGLSDSLRLAQLAGALAAALAAVEIVHRWRRSTWGRTDAVVPATILAGLLLVGHFFAGLEALPAVLLTVALLCLALPEGAPTWLRLAPLAPLVLALVLLAVDWASDDDYYDYSAVTAPGAADDAAALAPDAEGTGKTAVVAV